MGLAITLSEFDQHLWMVGGSAGALTLTGIAAASVFYLLKRPKPTKTVVPLHDQSLIEPGPEMVHASKIYKDPKDGGVLRYFKEDVRTIYDTFRQGAVLSNNGNCLGWRGGPNSSYVWQSYNDTLQRAKHFGSGLICLGQSPGQDTFLDNDDWFFIKCEQSRYFLEGTFIEGSNEVCIRNINIGIPQPKDIKRKYYMEKNCPEWIMAELAAYNQSMVVVPLYDTMGAEACAFIVNQTEMTVVVCEDDKKVYKFLEQSSKYLRMIITLKEVSSSTYQRAKNCGVDIYTFEEVEERGKLKDHPCVPPKPDDLCTICYTSGTTGTPKGVMITHASFVACIYSGVLQSGETNYFSKNDIIISFLPLAHMLERYCEHSLYMVGGSVGFFSGDLLRLTEDMVALKPTIMIAVPRMLNKIYDNAQVEISKSKTKKMFFNMALSAKEAEMKRGIIRNNSIWDKLVFCKLQEAMGGCLRLIMVSSAPLSGNVLTFVRCALGVQVIEGYGQTETTAAISTTIWGESVPEHVGPPMPSCKVKLVDVPEMDYYAAQKRGEVCVKGSSLFKGYYKDPERTNEVLDKDGWLHTGDIGQWLPNGALKIIDRRKYIFKLSQGEYIAPEKIQHTYLRSEYVEQIFVYGESLKSSLVAIVVPNEEAVLKWALANSIEGTFSSLCKDDRVNKMIIGDMSQWGKNTGLLPFEQVKGIFLHPDMFSIQNDLLTPTLKLKRAEVKNMFKQQIAEMYEDLDNSVIT